MKTATQHAVVTPSVLVLGLLFVAVLAVGLSGRKVPVLSNLKLDIVFLVGLGMAICTQAGIGRIAATGQWVHPQAILGYVLGGLILLVTLAAFAGWKLPFVQDMRQALIAVALLAGIKVANAVLHDLIGRA
jgi:hypothetical protein